MHTHANRIHAKPLSASLGVEILGLNPKHLSEEEKGAIKLLFDNHHFVLFRNADVTEEEHVSLVRAIGPISTADEIMKDGRQFTYISNVHADGRVPNGELFYHSDHMFLDEPLKGISLYSIEAPRVGGETRFLNSAKAYQAMPDDLKKRVEGLSARHVYDYDANRGDQRPDPATLSANTDMAVYPLVWRHPVSDVPLLYISRLFTIEVLGLSREESEKLLDDLFAYLDTIGDDYTHKWASGDLIVWDNLHLQHARNDFPHTERRALRRVPIALEAAYQHSG
ncbi:TauD/TfdA family dioxygenase [Sphingopyxis sp.]|uniref:TauD/TfdA dioxygenase family protein n=1 Tax=Sphingopyxis sp. TaxID=1908224 RepID=UPI002B469646|nr:TauD/TfdA family dioxygenase [Sphingopyxis sp.]HJS09794.1 TauD/TfdA family dioxygenase [Sphingopyxis sp.]